MNIDDHRPLLLILRTGRRELREYLLRSIVERYRVHMFTGQDITWEAEYVVGFTRCDNTLDDESLVASAKELTRRDPLAGVMTWDESRTPQAASIAAALGLPGGDPAVIERCRNKHLTRQALAAAGVPQPRSIKVTTPEQAEQAARQIGYPVVVKPSDLALSMGVARADNPEQLAEQVAFASAIRVPELPDYRVQVLIEEYAEGAEISVDSVVHDGRLTVLCVAHKVTGYEPYFIEVGHMVHGDDPLRTDPALGRLLSDTHRALGFRTGVTHTEVRLGPSGPKIIEVNGRLGGDLIPYLGLRATGVDVGMAAADVACGRPPSRVIADRSLVAGVRFFHVDRDGSVIESAGFDTADLPSTVDQLTIMVKPGDRRSIPFKDPLNARVAIATAVAGTVADCEHALACAQAALRLTVTAV